MSTETVQTSKPSLKIINDCVLEILLYLINDHYTLYNCIQINHDWCQLAIPLLWRNPFKSENPKMIQTLIYNFDASSKWQLRKRRAFNSFPSYSTLYNYSSYIRHFDFLSFKISVMKWLSKLLNRKPKYDEMIFVYQLVGSHVFKNTRGFITLSIDYDYSKINDDFDDFGDAGEIFDEEITSDFLEFYDISRFENFGNAMANIESLTYFYRGLEPTHCQKDFLKATSEIFKKLTIYCNNIQNLIIHSVMDGEFVEHIKFIRKITSEIIQNQQNLGSISFHEEWRDEKGNDTFFTSLTEYQQTKDSLKSLKFPYFSDIGGLLPFLTSCHSLETLEFTKYFCDYDVLEFCASSHMDNIISIHIKDLKFYQIQFETLYDKDNYIKAVEVLLRLSNNNLQSLTVENINDTIIQSISIYCSSLTYLSLKIFPKHFSKFVDILPSLNNLNHLILVEGYSSRHIRFNTQSFAKSFPSSLKHLGLDISINPKILGRLLDEMEVPITTLEIYAVMDLGYLEAIVKYVKIKNSHLKNLGFKSFVDNSLNNNRSLHNYMRVMSALYDLEISIYIVGKHLHSECRHSNIWLE